MRINVSTKELQDVTKKLLRIMPKKSSIPVLETLLVVAEGGVVTVTATDCSVSAIITLKTAEIEISGARAIPKETIQLIHKLKWNVMTITDDTVTAANRKVSYSGIDADVFPDVTGNRDYDQLAIVASKQQFMSIAEIRFACSEYESTPILTGILLRNKLAVATDRHRLALRPVPEYLLTRDIVIPGKVFEHAERLSEKAYTGDYKLSISEKYGYAQLAFDNVLMDFRLIDGTYPDVSSIMPKSFKAAAKLDKKAFMDELALMKEITSSDKHIVKLRAKDGKLVLSAESVDKINKIETELDATLSGNMDVMCFNAQLLLDGLKYNGNDEITLNFTGALSPAMIDDTYLILPFAMSRAA